MTDPKLLERIIHAEKYFRGTRYDSILKRASRAFMDDDIEAAREALNQLPSADKLLNDLVEKLRLKRNNHLFKTIKKIAEKRVRNDSTILKGLFSLGTHVAIEAERGNTEYRMLLPLIHEKLGMTIFGQGDS